MAAVKSARKSARREAAEAPAEEEAPDTEAVKVKEEMDPQDEADASDSEEPRWRSTSSSRESGASTPGADQDQQGDQE